jgi:putative PIN family toxin of toxin-antitoxin system
LRITLDTNLLVSGIFWGGTPAKIIELWLGEEIELCVSYDILIEYGRIIEKLGNKKKSTVGKEWTHLVQRKTSLFEVSDKASYSRDADDDKFIHCALAAKALYIVSGDQDLLVLEKVKGIEIITAKDFIERFLGE